MSDEDIMLSCPTLPVRVWMGDQHLGELQLISEIIDLFERAKKLDWGDDLVLLDAYDRPVFLSGRLPFVRP